MAAIPGEHHPSSGWWNLQNQPWPQRPYATYCGHASAPWGGEGGGQHKGKVG